MESLREASDEDLQRLGLPLRLAKRLKTSLPYCFEQVLSKRLVLHIDVLGGSKAAVNLSLTPRKMFRRSPLLFVSCFLSLAWSKHGLTGDLSQRGMRLGVMKEESNT